MEPISSRLLRRPGNAQRTAGGILTILGGGKPPAEDDDVDSLIKLNSLQTGSPEFKMNEARAKADLRNEYNPPEGYSNEADIPKSVGGMDLKGVKAGKGGRFVPEYGPIIPEAPEGFVNVGGKLVKDPAYNKPGLSPLEQIKKDKRMESLIGTVETNKLRRHDLEDGKNLLPKIPQGFFGGLKTNWMKAFDPNNPILTDWQKLKMIGTDAQLMNTARTKGAISDREMALFAQAAANDDMVSMARMQPVIDKLLNYMNTDEKAQRSSYQNIYGEDPTAFLDADQSGVFSSMKGGNTPSIPGNSGDSGASTEFDSPEAADASGLPAGKVVTVKGRRYQI